ncbi:hypothetical protein SAMN04488515_0966 [Cognatiyoonia koreensis]|uniref:Uncharacterized protein n=1 Tax=Cognatiyoonia koreensis TaxID=364200 RepID=A0A1I0P1L9_9RHOB|nr:DUF6477 family protein [Cognatiyoonia koreensis]SEW08235.1 hypothetical protein SAMN04488515_0966 [Cognatiyoonia koreensis]
MLDITALIGKLQRPKLLVRAARFGLDDYRRERDLPRALKSAVIPRTGEALLRLSDLEAEMNEKRELQDAAYSYATHIDLLIAIMAEARLFEATHRRRTIR